MWASGRDGVCGRLLTASPLATILFTIRGFSLTATTPERGALALRKLFTSCPSKKTLVDVDIPQHVGHVCY